MENQKSLKGLRLAGIDYGLKRVGCAVTDELHITFNPKLLLDPNKDDFWEKLLDFLNNDNIGAIVVGVPYRDDDIENPLIDTIKIFIDQLKEKSGLDVYEQDESFSSVGAASLMVSMGKKKKKRAEKGQKDMVAAAIILRDFLKEIEG